MRRISLSPYGEDDVLAQLRQFGIVEDNKLLICGRVDEELITFLRKDVAHLLRHNISMTRNVEVQVVGEECIELQTVESALSNNSTVLLLDAEEVRMSVVVGKDNSLAAECSYRVV